MRILFTRFPLESTYGGAEVQTLSLMKGLRARGHEAGFLGSCHVLLGKLQELGMKNYALRIGNPPVTKWGVVSFLWRQRRMKRLLTSYFLRLTSHPDAICMLSLTEKLLLTEWATERGIRVFWIEHDRIGRWLRWNPWLPRLRRLSRLATTVVVSDLSKRMYVELGWDPETTVVIPNGIDMQRFQKTDARSQEDSRKQIPDPMCVGASSSPTTYNLTSNTSFRVGTVARLSHEKGVDLLIEAVKDLPNVHLTIVGTGRDEDRIRRRIARINSGTQPACSSSLSDFGVEDRQGREPKNLITLLPSVPDVTTFYRSLDLFILPSRDHDPCPLAPIEAMACGVPVVLTDACGTAGYLEYWKDALIVPTNSVGALKEAIFKIQNDRNFRHHLSTRGPQIVAERFSMERMVEEYEHAFNKNSPHI